MKILLISVGTRGDMEPFLAIAEILKKREHQVICAFPEQFRNLAEESGFAFASLGAQFIELLESEEGKAAMGGSSSGFKKFVALIKLASKQTNANKELVHKQFEIVQKEKPDRIVYNGKATYPILWELDNPGKTTFISAIPYMHYVKGHTHVAFNSNWGSFLNKLTFSLAHFGMVTTTLMSKKWLGLNQKVSRKQIRAIITKGKAIYTISPSLFARPSYWYENLKVLGYHEYSKTTHWQPDKALTEFVERHDKILFITFGSMLNPNPEEKTKTILDILQRNKIPAIINTASGGLVKPDGYNPELFHFVTQIPYKWVFPKVYGVIHHGGSGTTHLVLKYGCASMVIPHIIDQFVWNRIVSDLGAGPKGMGIGKVKPKPLESKILDLWNNMDYKHKAEEMSQQMKEEDFEDELYRAIIE